MHPTHIQQIPSCVMNQMGKVVKSCTIRKIQLYIKPHVAPSVPILSAQWWGVEWEVVGVPSDTTRQGDKTNSNSLSLFTIWIFFIVDFFFWYYFFFKSIALK